MDDIRLGFIGGMAMDRKTILIVFLLSTIMQIKTSECSNIHIEKEKFYIGLGGGVGNNNACNLAFNIKGQLCFTKHHSIGILLSKGSEFYLGAEQREYEKDEFDDIEAYNDIGLLYIYEPNTFITGPYFGAGISYFAAKDHLNRHIKQIGIPLDIGVNISLYKRLTLSFGYLGNINSHGWFNGVCFRIGI